jgi:hypothetical protein
MDLHQPWQPAGAFREGIEQTQLGDHALEGPDIDAHHAANDAIGIPFLAYLDIEWIAMRIETLPQLVERGRDDAILEGRQGISRRPWELGVHCGKEDDQGQGRRAGHGKACDDLTVRDELCGLVPACIHPAAYPGRARGEDRGWPTMISLSSMMYDLRAKVRLVDHDYGI